MSIDGTLTDTTTSGHSEPGNNGNEGVCHTPKFLKLEPHHEVWFSVIPRTTHFFFVVGGGGVIFLSR